MKKVEAHTEETSGNGQKTETGTDDPYMNSYMEAVPMVLAVIIRKILLMPEELMAVRMRPVRPIWRI